MINTVEFPFPSKELRSLVTENATLQLSFESVEITPPVGNELVVRVDGATVNPSDIGLMLGTVPADIFQASGDDQSPVLTASIDDETFARLKDRVGQSLSVGLEGMGVVIAAGPESEQYLGKKIAMVGGGMYAQYRKVVPDSCLVLPDDATPEGSAGTFVNPMTSLALVETMRREGHTSLVHTAAASNLGQMLLRICLADGINLVNVVRSEKQVELLKGMGARFVCNSSSPGFDDELVKCISETGATIAFDAVGGGDLASRILAAMEKANAGKVPYSRYGSRAHKQVYFYGGLDRSPVILRKNYGMAWGAGGWLLFPFLEKIAPETTEAMKMRILRELKTTFASGYGQSVALNELLDPANIVAAGARSTGAKLLIKPQHG